MISIISFFAAVAFIGFSCVLFTILLTQDYKEIGGVK